jgi:hypothetical protein
MKTIILPADLTSDLDWAVQRQEALASSESLLWELDFGFHAPRFFLNDQAAFQSFTLAMDQFCLLWKEFSARSKGVILYRGSLDIVQRVIAAEELTLVEAASVLGDFLHRLASFLPDEAAPYCLFETTPFGKALSAQLMSKERFLHIHLSLEELRYSRGVLLPPDELCTDAVLNQLEILLNRDTRVIPEKHLNEMWDGLDELTVIESAVSLQGKRHLAGFIAAGGEVKKFGAEGFEPPTHCSQSSCASQTALCSERGK